MKLMTGNSNKPLAAAIADYIEIPLTDASVRRFADEEVFVEIHENVRGEDVFVIQSTAYPTNDNLMELLIMIDALKRASAKRITAVIPYYGYARQDRKVAPRAPISAKLVADLLDAIGADEMLVTPAIGREAIEVMGRYGKLTGHPAKLNMGDALSYACASAFRVPLLYKGDDFSKTDLA